MSVTVAVPIASGEPPSKVPPIWWVPTLPDCANVFENVERLPWSGHCFLPSRLPANSCECRAEAEHPVQVLRIRSATA